MKIVLAIDSFKGSLTSREAEEAVETALRTFLHSDTLEIISIPMADGGEGMLESLIKATGAEARHVTVCNPLMEPTDAQYAVLPAGRAGAASSKIAFVEMARTSGLTLIDESRRNPMLTTTYGLGQLMANAMENGCTEFIVGIGGSATNDAGCGMLQALGYRFFNDKGLMETPVSGGMLQSITGMDCSARNPLLDKVHITVACDVKNPLYGERGAACVYAPQKGANREMVKLLDAGLEHFSKVVESLSPECGSGAGKSEMAMKEGAGAAGGLGFAFASILGAELVSGAQTVLQATGFYDSLRGCNFVVTGEGRLDAQTSNGKLPQCVLRAASERGIPVVAIAGRVENCDGYYAALEVSPSDMPLEVAMRKEVAQANIMEAIKRNISIFA